MKVLLIFALVCAMASCELHWKLKKHTHTKNQRILFKQQASIYGIIDSYTDSDNQYIETPFSNGEITAKLAVSLFDNYIWVPAKGCQNTNDVKSNSTTAASCGTFSYECKAPNCNTESLQNVTDFTSFYTSSNPVQVTTLTMVDETFQIKGQAVSGIEVALVSAMTNKDSFQQDGVLGLGYGNSLVSALVDNKVILKQEFSYYISDTESFLTFGIHDNYLSKFPVVQYTFDNGNLCTACPAQESTNKWSLLISDLVCADTNTSVAGVVISTSRLVFDTTTQGYSLSSDSYDAMKTFMASHKGVSTCTDNTAGFFNCKCTDGLDSLPTLELTFEGNTQAWSLTPEKYAEVAADSTCNIYFTYRNKTNTDMDDHIFAGRLFTKFFFTSFDSDNNLIKVANAFQQPDPYMMSDATIGVVLSLGIVIILAIFITINAILKPAKISHEIKAVVGVELQQNQHTGYVYSSNKVEPTQTIQRNVQKQQ